MTAPTFVPEWLSEAPTAIVVDRLRWCADWRDGGYPDDAVVTLVDADYLRAWRIVRDGAGRPIERLPMTSTELGYALRLLTDEARRRFATMTRIELYSYLRHPCHDVRALALLATSGSSV